MKFTASDIKKLKHFYRSDSLTLTNPGSRILNWFKENFDVLADKSAIKMDVMAKQQARHDLKVELGFDVIEGIPDDADRMEVSKSVLDEKLASVNPDDTYVLVNSPQNQLQLASGIIALPSNTSLRVPVSQLNPAAYQHIVIIENLDVFDALPVYPIPLEGATLFAYRGHEKSIAKGVKSLIQKAQNQVPVYWFGDLDPKGLELAFSAAGVDYIVSADISHDVTSLKSVSLVDKWLAQESSVHWCQRHTAHPLINTVLNHHLAVMQQHLLSRNIALSVYKT